MKTYCEPETEFRTRAKPALSVVIPTLNEGSNLLALIKRVDGALEGRHYELIIVDDGSSDGTRDLVRDAASTYPVRLICRDKERGLGSAVTAGFEQAVGDYLGVMDADLQHPPELIPRLLHSVENGADIAIASRYTGGASSKGLALGRQVVSWGARTSSRLFLPSVKQVRDPMSGFFLLKKRVIKDLELHPIGHNLLLEILVKAEGTKVEEIPYDFEVRSAGASKLNPREYFDYLRLLSALACRDLDVGRFMRFCLVGIGGVALALVSMWLLTSVLGLFYFASALITSLLCITSNFILNDLWTFKGSSWRQSKALFIRWAKFNVSRWLLFLLGLALVPLFVEVAGLHYLLATIIIIGIQTVINYTASVAWIWRE